MTNESYITRFGVKHASGYVEVKFSEGYETARI